MQEVWKEIPGFETKYAVSSFGNVKNLKRNKLLSPSKSKSNHYLKFSLGLGKKDKMWTIPVHRLVAMTFLPNPYNLPEVHHIDHNKENNRLDNLQWVSKSDNIKAAIAAGKHNGGFKVGIKHHSGKFTDTQIKWMRELHKEGYTYSEICEIFEISRGTLSEIINNKKRILKEEKKGFMVNCKSFPVYSVCPKY